MPALITIAVLGSTLILLGYLLFIWWLDRYEREPFWTVLLVLAWGGLGGTSLGCLCSLPFAIAATSLGGETFGGAFTAVAVAPVVEEITKGLIFLVLIPLRSMDNETDGLIYGAAAGLGFAAVENVLYFLQAAEGGAAVLLGTVFIRTFFSSLVHSISSALLGMCLGHAVHRAGPLRWLAWSILGVLLAALNHALWNGLATAAELRAIGEMSGVLVLLGMLLVAGASVLMFLLTQWSLRREHAVISRELLAEAAEGTLPAEHAAIIPFWTRRRRDGWLPPGVPRERYVRAATLLAFRRRQLEIARGERADRYAADIHRFRAEVRAMLGSARGASATA